MSHPVYRALDKPIKLLGVHWQILAICFFASLASHYVFGRSYLAIAITWAIIHGGGYFATKDDPQKIPLWIAKRTQPHSLDPMARDDSHRIRILYGR